MTDKRFEFGDRVRHAKRPEWGIGSIVKAEEMSVNGVRAQRVSVRFPNAGLKTISTAHAELEIVGDLGDPAGDGGNSDHPVAAWDKMKDSEWLGEVAQRKVDEVMVSVSPQVRDPFNSLKARLTGCLALYRFDRTGRGLIDWAVAQSGLDDPLSRFTRHELELLFDQWATQRDEHLDKLLSETGGDRSLINELLASAPREAAGAVRRLTSNR